jgi:hypothetical protein
VTDDIAVEFRNAGNFHWGIDEFKEDAYTTAAQEKRDSILIPASARSMLESDTEKEMDLENSEYSSDKTMSEQDGEHSINSVARRTLVKELSNHKKNISYKDQVYNSNQKSSEE